MKIKMVLFRFIFLLFFYNLSIECYSQISLNGKIMDKDSNETLPFANVILYDASDTLSVSGLSLTDMYGAYIIKNLSPGKYIMKIFYTGYEEYKHQITLRMPSGNNIITRDFKLSLVSNKLDEVTVAAKRKTVYVDHTKHIFTEIEKKKARHIADLLENVEDLNIDPVTGNLVKLSGGNVTILINGINSSVSDLKSIPADKIRYVEYYTIPPTRFPNSVAVVNVIIGNLERGGAEV